MGRHIEEKGERTREEYEREGGRRGTGREGGRRGNRGEGEGMRERGRRSHTDQSKVIRRLKKGKSKLFFMDQ